MRPHFSLPGVAALALLAALAGPVGAIAAPAGAPVVISQIYPGGGNARAVFRRDYVELHNRGTATVSLAGWTLQYAPPRSDKWQALALAGSIGPGRYRLLKLAPGNGGGADLPQADGDGALALGAAAGKLALVADLNPLHCRDGCAGMPGVIDFVGYGAASASEGATAPAPGKAAALLRRDAGCADSGDNRADFDTGTPLPRSSASAARVCDAAVAAPAASAPNYAAPADAGRAARIHDIQGRAHVSPFAGQRVRGVTGIVTALRDKGFFLQDPQPDGDPLTSEGVHVFTDATPEVEIGDALRVDALVREYRPGNADENLSVTELVEPRITVVEHNRPLPAPVLIGAAGSRPPTRAAWAAPAGDVEAERQLDPARNGIDFYEQFEGMRLAIADAVAVGPSTRRNDVVLLPDGGAWAGPRSARGGIIATADDVNPERIQVTGGGARLPHLDVGDRLAEVIGVLDYARGDYRLLATALGAVTRGGLAPETARRQRDDELAVASFNVENLSPLDPPDKFDRLAHQIVRNLQSPDLLGLMEIQDDSGPAHDRKVTSERTFVMLEDAIRRAGGPAYRHRAIDPVDGADGGQPGGNIRQGLLFNPARVSFVDRAGGGATAAVRLTRIDGQIALSSSPGRIAPTDPAFAGSRKPLAGEFVFHGQKLFVIANHFNSKGGDKPLFGRIQPPEQASRAHRGRQALVVADFVKQLLAANAEARVIVLGDLNDYEWSPPLATLKAAGLADLVETLAPAERYTYVFEGNSQVLDHILVSRALAAGAEYDVVHVTAEFADQTSDHDPEVARLLLPARR